MMAKANGFLVAIASVLILLVVSFMQVPEVLRGEKIIQGDKLHFVAGSKPLVEAHAQTAEMPRWTNDMYGGMPSTFIYPKYPNNLVYTTLHSQFMPNEMKLFFLPAFFVWAALMLGGFNWLVSLAGALAYGFTTVVAGNVEASHGAKVLALGTIIPLLVGVNAAFKGRLLIAFLLLTFFTAVNVACNHLQITYYTVIMIVCMALIRAVFAIKNGKGKSLIKVFLVLTVSAIIGVLPNISLLWSSYDYSQYTTRGEQILESTESAGEGLASSSVFEYSYSFSELLSVIIPRMVGGSSSEYLGTKSASYKVLSSSGIERQRKEGNQVRVPLFWGDKPLNGAPGYLGVVLFCLFLFGFVAISKKEQILFAVLIGIILIICLGDNVAPLSTLLYEYLPLYSKFRAPSMAIGVFSALMVLAMATGMQKILVDGQFITREKRTLFITIFSVLALLILIGSLGPTFSSLTWEWGVENTGITMDESVRRRMLNYGYPENAVNAFFRALQQDRAMIMRYDAFRSAFLVLIVLGSLFVLTKRNIKVSYVIGFLVVVGVAELLNINRSYLNQKDFAQGLHFEQNYPETPSFQSIKELAVSTDRLIDVSTNNPWMDARPSYYMSSIGGMQGAKLRRFQDLIDRHLNEELSAIRSRKRVASTPVLNMLNTRFIKIGNNERDYLENVTTYGPAWFVDNVKWVNTPEEEINQLANVNLAETAVINTEFDSRLQFDEEHESLFSSIEVVEKSPYRVEYRTFSDKPGLLVLSEIWYRGNSYWKSSIDGVEKEHIRANYALRAIEVPAGSHTVTFEYHDLAYENSEPIAAVGSGIFVLSLILAGFRLSKNSESVLES